MPRVTGVPRNSVNDRPSAWRLALRRQRRLLRPAAWIAVATAAGVVAVLGAHAVASRAGSGGTLVGLRERFAAMTAASGLRVTEVVIEGQANTPEALLRAAIGVSKGDPILGFSLEDTRSRLEMIPWIEHATVERRLPNTLVISLQERRPYAIWQNQGKFVLVDRAGQVVANQDVAAFRHLPLIVGLGAPGAAAQILDALRERPALAEKVSASVRVGERRWNLRMTNGTDVLLPEGHEVVALDRLIQLHQQHAVLDRALVAIDLRLPDRLVFRARPDDKAGGDKAGGDKPGADKPGGDKPGADKAGADKAGADKAGADKAGADKAGADKAGVVVPALPPRSTTPTVPVVAKKST